MCISEQTSLNTFLIGLSSSIFLYSKGSVLQAANIFALSLMQLAEYFMWKGVCPSNFDKIGNLIGILSLALQCVLIPLTVKNVNVIHMSIILFFLYIAVKYVRAGYPCTTETNKGHLRWGFWDVVSKTDILIGAPLYAYGILGLTGTPLSLKLLYTFIFLFAINITGANLYNVDKYGSIWCYMVNIGGPLLVFNN
jgi:hypothetical protein